MALTLKSALVTGGAGFIGSHLVDSLTSLGWKVNVLDDLSSGRLKWIEGHLQEEEFGFFKGDINDRNVVAEALDGCDCVFHLAAYPVIRGGFADEERRSLPVRNNILGTHSILEAMADAEAKAIAFSSSSVVYGEADLVPTPEDYGPMKPISLYGASKLAAEALVTAYSHGFGNGYWIFRFANIVGTRSTQGVVSDFVAKLRNTPGVLEILGDGKQSKCYMHVRDCVDAMLYCMEKSTDEIFNLGTPTPITVDRVAEIVEEEMGLGGVEHRYTGGSGGWKGDLPQTFLDSRKIRALGWSSSRDSEEAVRESVRGLLEEL